VAVLAYLMFVVENSPDSYVVVYGSDMTISEARLKSGREREAAG
jgi:hypothetical protein